MNKSYFNSSFYYQEYKFNNIIISVFCKSNINWGDVLKNLNKIRNYLKNIDCIYYGKHDSLKRNKNVSYYENNSIIISNSINTTQSFLKCVIHECVHSFADNFEQIRGFNEAKEEYLEKKKFILHQIGSPGEEYEKLVYYNKDFDQFLINYGYNKLKNIIGSVFPSPYSITSFIEYVACIAEEFFFDEGLTIEKLCPYTILFLKKF